MIGSRKQWCLSWTDCTTTIWSINNYFLQNWSISPGGKSNQIWPNWHFFFLLCKWNIKKWFNLRSTIHWELAAEGQPQSLDGEGWRGKRSCSLIKILTCARLLWNVGTANRKAAPLSCVWCWWWKLFFCWLSSSSALLRSGIPLQRISNSGEGNTDRSVNEFN